MYTLVSKGYNTVYLILFKEKNTCYLKKVYLPYSKELVPLLLYMKESIIDMLLPNI